MDENETTGLKRHGTLIWVLGILVLLFCAFVLFRVAGAQKVENEMQAIRDAGFPDSVAALDAWYEPVADPTQNAALEILAALTAMQANADFLAAEKIVEKRKISWDGNEAISDEERAEYYAFADAGAADLDALRLAAKLSQSRYPVDLKKGFVALLPHLSPLRNGARALKYDAKAAMLRGDYDRACQSTLAIFQLSLTLKDEPLLISGLVRIVIDAIGVETLQCLVRQHALSDEQRRAFVDALAKCESYPVMRRAIIGEICACDDIFRNHTSYGSSLGMLGGSGVPSAGEKLLLGLYGASGLKDLDHAFLLNFLMGFQKAAAEQDPTVRLTKIRAIGPIGRKTIPRHHLISGMILPAVDKSLEKESNWLAMLRTARQSLDDVGSASLIDPYTGLPLNSIKTKDGISVVYSIGANLTDDGGTYDPKKRRDRGDVIFEVPAVEEQ